MRKDKEKFALSLTGVHLALCFLIKESGNGILTKTFNVSKYFMGEENGKAGVKCLKEETVERLLDFGLTTNQAKVYLSIVQSGSAHVKEISEATRLHRQDIYKILPKLEKMGLIIKTLGKPFIFNAVPAEKALSNIISIEREKANERISRMETNLKGLINAIREKVAEQQGKQSEERFILLDTEAEIRNMTKARFENSVKKYDLVVTPEIIIQRLYPFCEQIRKLRTGVRMRIIVESLDNKDAVKSILEKIRSAKGDFSAKLVYKKSAIPYRIIDNKEVWISREKMTETNLPAIILTNDKNIVKSYRERFTKSWNDSNAVCIYPE